MKTLQVSEVNLESRSETISYGRLWSLHISLAKMRARSSAVLPFGGSGIKCAILVNRSMTTQSSVQPINSGRSVMKSMAIDCRGACGSSSRDRRPYWRCRRLLSC